MKIIGGIFGGRRLNAPINNDIRPTSDKIRGAIFNMLQSRNAIDGANTLDAFCGTGALGLEALSRGASHCDFMDKAKSSLDLAKDNADLLGADNNAKFTIKDSSKITGTNLYDLVFLDPPYNKGLIQITLDALINGECLSNGAWIICESEYSFSCSPTENITIDNVKTYGDTKVTLLRHYKA